MLDDIRKVLRCVCYHCSRLLLDKSSESTLNEIKRTRNNKTKFDKVLRVCDKVNLCDELKGGCGYRQPKFTKDGLKIMVEYDKEDER
jgi:DNA-directed RNA polymerase II subunit RPB1